MFMEEVSGCVTELPSSCALPGAHVSPLPALAEGTPQWCDAKEVDASLAVVSHAREAACRANGLAPLHENIALISGAVERTTWGCHDGLASFG